MRVTRREFAKKLGQAGAGLALAGCTRREAEPPQRPKTAGQPTVRRLGKTDLLLSRVGFGAQRTRDADLIRYALDQGMNHIETAWSYGFGRPGNSCQCIGKAIAGRRASVCLAVAFEGAPPPESKVWLAYQFEQTLRDLATDHIDVFLWHDQSGSMVNNRPLSFAERQTLVSAGPRVELMLKWKKEGKLRYCGLSTHLEQPEWLRFVARSGLYDVAVVAFNYKSPAAVVSAVKEAAEAGIGIIAMKTQSPDYRDGPIGGAPDHRQALHWVLSNDYVTAAIPGMTTRSQVELNLRTMKAAV